MTKRVPRAPDPRPAGVLSRNRARQRRPRRPDAGADPRRLRARSGGRSVALHPGRRGEAGRVGRRRPRSACAPSSGGRTWKSARKPARNKLYGTRKIGPRPLLRRPLTGSRRAGRGARAPSPSAPSGSAAGTPSPSSPGPARSRTRPTPSGPRRPWWASPRTRECPSSTSPPTTRPTARPSRSYRGPGLREGLRILRAGARDVRVPRALRRPRARGGAGGGRGPGSRPDPRVPLPPDRPRPRLRPERPPGQRQEGPVPGAVGHAERRGEAPERRAARTCS